ncbi:hypothetical protein [Streptomyces sp. CBMA123]|uniref:hypothetical protein n=1 Tax=Streptomyces sp. CBMA123 TaxID=1896313 RepID=UPI001661A617|nr:hypothetical protein [Streptomyces sp. CBMA123]MBD0694169.1 hypothetical protein [Streptomyces sp. CBMA123]
MRGAVLEITAWFSVLVGVTVVSISSLSPVELLVAAVAALGGAFAARRLRLAANVTPGGTRGAVRAVVRLPGAILRGSAVLAAALLDQPQTAGLHRLRLLPGVGAGWAPVLLAASPDTCVLEIDRPDAVDEVLVHALGRGPGPVERVVAAKGEGEP